MRRLAALAVALGCCVAAVLAGCGGAVAEQSYLYPPEVRARPVVVVPDPTLQRRYWDPRYDDLYGAAAPRRWRCWRECR